MYSYTSSQAQSPHVKQALEVHRVSCLALDKPSKLLMSCSRKINNIIDIKINKLANIQMVPGCFWVKCDRYVVAHSQLKSSGVGLKLTLVLCILTKLKTEIMFNRSCGFFFSPPLASSVLK